MDDRGDPQSDGDLLGIDFVGVPDEIRVLLRQRWLALEHEAANDDARRSARETLGDVGRAEASILADYAGRYPLELLQNAHDAIADAGIRGPVQFVLTETALLVANVGVPFDADRIVSITRIGGSEKVAERSTRHVIGFKGIGFTAVFEITDRPQIYTRLDGTSFSFCFDGAAATARVNALLGSSGRRAASTVEMVPARYFPFEVPRADADRDGDVVERLLRDGAVTVIRLPLRGVDERERIARELSEALRPELLLFMPVITSLELDLGQDRLTWTRADGGRAGSGRIIHVDDAAGERRSWVVSTALKEVDPRLTANIREPAWKGVTHVNVGVALPWSGTTVAAATESTSIHVYFPTEDHLSRAVLVHGDFYLDASRRHVNPSGNFGALNGQVASGVADLVVELAESLAPRHARGLLRALAPSGPSAGFGSVVSDALDGALRQARILRCAAGRTVTPAEAMSLPRGIGPERERVLVALMDRRDDLVRPGDVETEGVAAWLTSLGNTAIQSDDVAGRIDLRAAAHISYAHALSTLEAWLLTLPAWWQSTVAVALRTRFVVRDLDGGWATADQVERRPTGAPEMPATLRRRELDVPASPMARDFIDRLGIVELTPRTALERLLEALRDGRFGHTQEQAREAFEFATALWHASPDAFHALPADLVGLVPVPVRAPRERATYVPAGHAYFPQGWTDSPILEHLYSGSARAEFLMEPPPPAGRQRRRQFYDALGVAAWPRMVNVAGSARDLALYREWRRLDDVDAAFTCPSAIHTKGSYLIEVEEMLVLDRLDWILERCDPRRSKALALALLHLTQPFGERARIRCTGSHGGYPKAQFAQGYQSWRLLTTDWVTVSRDPAGATTRTPGRSWVGIGTRHAKMLVPQARLDLEDGRRLQMVPAAKPGSDAVLEAIGSLASAFPEPGGVDAEVRDLVVRTALWLMTELERSLGGSAQVASRPRLLSYMKGQPVWDSAPLVADLASALSIVDRPVLPAGRWPRLRRALGLERVSETLHPTVRHGRGVADMRPLLPGEARAALLASLMPETSEADLIASRLGLIEEHCVTWVAIDWRSERGRQRATEQAAAFLDVKRDKAKRPIGATLWWTSDYRTASVTLGRDIAEYLRLPDAAYRVSAFLQDQKQYVDAEGIPGDRIADARALLRQRRRRARDIDVPSPVGGMTSDESAPVNEFVELADGGGWIPPSGASHPANPADKYVDTARISFGAPRDIPAKPPAERDEETDGPTERKRRKKRSAGSGASGTPKSAPASGDESEVRAVSIVAQWARRELHAQVKDVQDDGLGWDLEFHFADGRVEYVEVKGSAGQSPLIITVNEVDAARAHPDRWVLYRVTGLRKPATPLMREYRTFGSDLRDADLKVSAYYVSNLDALPSREVDVTED